MYIDESTAFTVCGCHAVVGRVLGSLTSDDQIVINFLLLVVCFFRLLVVRRRCLRPPQRGAFFRRGAQRVGRVDGTRRTRQ
jgi:hypothetical protein